jgi:hypothetical protein
MPAQSGKMDDKHPDTVLKAASDTSILDANMDQNSPNIHKDNGPNNGSNASESSSASMGHMEEPSATDQLRERLKAKARVKAEARAKSKSSKQPKTVNQDTQMLPLRLPSNDPIEAQRRIENSHEIIELYKSMRAGKTQAELEHWDKQMGPNPLLLLGITLTTLNRFREIDGDCPESELKPTGLEYMLRPLEECKEMQQEAKVCKTPKQEESNEGLPEALKKTVSEMEITAQETTSEGMM